MKFKISVGVTGFEPATSWSQTRRSSQAEPHPVICLYAFLFFCLTRDIFYNFYFCLSSTFFCFFQHFFVVILFSRFVSGSLPSTCCIIPSFFSSVNTFFQKSLNNSKNSKQFWSSPFLLRSFHICYQTLLFFYFKNASGTVAVRCTSSIIWHILLCTSAIRRRLYQVLSEITDFIAGFSRLIYGHDHVTWPASFLSRIRQTAWV